MNTAVFYWQFHKLCAIFHFGLDSANQKTIYLKLKKYKTGITLCKILGFHGRDYEECHLLGYDSM
jgi:hypothetical protein